MSELFEQYKNEIIPKLREKFGYENVMQVPKIEKIVLNMGLGEAIKNAKIIESAAAELSLITGQKPIVTLSKK
jgi:large subunit ribosomal protein L5